MAIIDKIQLSGTVYTIGNETTTAVTSASTDNEIPTAKAVYNAIPQGGGGTTYTAGRGIDITNDTISVSLPISAGTGTNSVTEGISTTASGLFSHAEGSGTKANGTQSHAEGSNTIASGVSSHAEGYATIASGIYSHAEGENTIASGNSSHAEGKVTKANGGQSHAEGYQTVANGRYSHAEGYYSIANNQSEHASGQYNNSVSASTTWGDSGNTLFSVGNGTLSSARHNAFEIRQNGDIYITKDGQDVKLQDQLGGSSINVVQTTGTSTADVMSQDAVTTVINTVSGAIPSTYVSAISIDTVLGWLRFARFSTPSNYNYFILDNPKINGTPIHKFTGVESQINQFSLVETSAITTSVTSSSTDAQVPSAKAVNDKLGGLSVVKLTQAEYDALATKDSSTIYFIVG